MNTKDEYEYSLEYKIELLKSTIAAKDGMIETLKERCNMLIDTLETLGCHDLAHYKFPEDELPKQGG